MLFTLTRPLFVSLKLGMTDKGNRLKPIYAKVQPDLIQFSLPCIVSISDRSSGALIIINS